MNFFFSLPYDMQNKILFFVKTSHANSIIKAWKRYSNYKKFILFSIYSLPKFYSFIDNHLIYSVVCKKTHFLFKKLYYITTGKESFFNCIYQYFYQLALSIDDYEWISAYDNIYYSYNKFYCISIALKFKWNKIIKILE